MIKPSKCILWDKPEIVREGTVKDLFELMETYADDSHLWRYLFKCRECGQVYFFEFYEEIHWVGG